jgi:hypothetical protein
MIDVSNAVIETADKMIDKHHGVSNAIKHVELKIDECIDSGITYKNHQSMDNGSIQFWVDVHNVLRDRLSLEI